MDRIKVEMEISQENLQAIVNQISQSVCGNIKDVLSNIEKPNEYLSANDICKRFGITKPTVYEWRDRGILVARKLGARVYYRMDEIEEAMIVDSKM
jgi:predicted DNA-binding transcriptional regulator AlpA